LLQKEERKCRAAWTVATVRNSIIWADTHRTIGIVLYANRHRKNIVVRLKLDSPAIFWKE